MFENTAVNTLSITNTKRNILATLQTNDDILHELDDDEQSSVRSSDDDTNTKNMIYFENVIVIYQNAPVILKKTYLSNLTKRAV